jgi:hypothetical protein
MHLLLLTRVVPLPPELHLSHSPLLMPGMPLLLTRVVLRLMVLALNWLLTLMLSSSRRHTRLMG